MGVLPFSQGVPAQITMENVGSYPFTPAVGVNTALVQATATTTAASSNAAPINEGGLVPNAAGLGGTIANLPINAAAYSSVNTSNVAQLAPYIVTETGLNVTPWYADNGLITGNPRLRKEVQPVSFQVMLHDNTDFLLASGGTGTPITVQLNASMKSINWSMKHIYHHQRTRTAQHITMWGMQADTIEGQCTTGVFMNQFGLTDYYSTRTIDDKLKTLVSEMFDASDAQGVITNTGQSINNNNEPNNGGVGGLMIPFNNLTTVTGPNGQSVTTATGDPNFSAVMNSASRNNPNFTQTEAFRVAAQDAFMEFLALFKMNGLVWFWNKPYDGGAGTNRDWDGIQTWSPVLGMSSSQKNGRNNDVMTRGGVIMSYRNFVYQGYFKSLQWQMDARNPYKWDFSFTFQVEKTVGQQFIPN